MSDGGRRNFLDVLSQEERRALLARARNIRARKGQTIVAKGEASRDVFLIQEGRVEVLLYAASGREVSLRTLSEGQLFGELAAIDGEARSASIIAVSDARLLAMSPQAFRSVIADSREAADWLVRRLTAQIRSLTNRVFELSALHVQARLHCELLRLVRSQGDDNGLVDPAPTHAELASRIGTHREAVTRELSLLARRNIVRSGRRHLEFLDIERLEEELRATLRQPVEPDEGW